jgi:hypothetical protein
MVYVEVYMNCNHKWPWGLVKLTNVSTYVLIKFTYVFVVLPRIIGVGLLLYWDEMWIFLYIQMVVMLEMGNFV